MTSQQRLMLAKLKGRVDGQMQIAKGAVRASCICRDEARGKYQQGFSDGGLYKAVNALRAMRDVQRHVDEFCKGVGYHA